jgi:hypothetical protein
MKINPGINRLFKKHDIFLPVDTAYYLQIKSKINLFVGKSSTLTNISQSKLIILILSQNMDLIKIKLSSTGSHFHLFQIEIHPPNTYTGWMDLARFVFSGSCVFIFELNCLKSTANIMQHDSTKISEFGSIRPNVWYSFICALLLWN